MAQLDVTVKETGISQTAEKLDELATSGDRAEKATAAMESSVAKADSRIIAYIDSLKLQNATFGQSQDAIDLYRAKLLGATEAQLAEIDSIQKDISAKKEMASASALASAQAVAAAQAEAAATKAAADAAEKEAQRKSASLDSYIESLKLQNATFGQSQHEVDLYRAKLLGATDAQVREISEIQRAISAKQKLASTTNTAGTATGNLGRNLGKIPFGQIGYQVQDLTVQLQNGTSAFVAIGQQGSQLAGAFGPGGAVIGAVIALGSAIAGMAYNAANAEADLTALEAAGRRLSDLNLDTLVRMNDAQRDLADPANKQRYKEMGDEILSLTQKYENQSLTTQALRENLQKVTDDMPSWTKSTAQYNEEVSAASAKLKESLAEEAKIRSQVNGIQKQQDALYQGEIDKKRALERENKKAGNTASSSDNGAAKQAERDAKALEASKKAAADYITQLQQRNMSELALIDAHEQEKIAKLADYRSKGAIEEEQFEAARKEAALTARNERMKYYEDEARQQAEISADAYKAEQERRKEEQDTRDKNFDNWATGQQNLTDNLKSTLGEQNAAYKAAAIISATIDTYKAATGAYASLSSIPYVGPALGITAAGAALAFGFKQVQAITGAGRMQGGQVSAGDVRMVGERGPELVRFGSNGMVTPNSALGGTTTTQQVVNVHNYAGTAVSTQQNSDGSTDIFIRKDELADLLASQAGNPNSKMNRAQGGVYERRRA